MSECVRGVVQAILWTLGVVGGLLMVLVVLVVLVTLRLLWHMMGLQEVLASYPTAITSGAP